MNRVQFLTLVGLSIGSANTTIGSVLLLIKFSRKPSETILGSELLEIFLGLVLICLIVLATINVGPRRIGFKQLFALIGSVVALLSFSIPLFSLAQARGYIPTLLLFHPSCATSIFSFIILGATTFSTVLMSVGVLMGEYPGSESILAEYIQPALDEVVMKAKHLPGYVHQEFCRLGPSYLRNSASKNPILLVMIVAFLLRFYGLSQQGVFLWDEMSFIGFGRSLLHGGKVSYYPTYSLLLSLIFLLFGESDYVALALSAFAGVLTVYLTFLLGKEFDGRIGLLAASFLTVMEYHVFYSRTALVESLVICLTILFIITYLHGMTAIAGHARRGALFDRSLFICGVLLGITLTTKELGGLMLLVILFSLHTFVVLREGIRVKQGMKTLFLIVGTGAFVSFLIYSSLFVSGHLAPFPLLRYLFETGRSSFSLRLPNVFLVSYLSLWAGPLFVGFIGLGSLLCARSRRIPDITLLTWFYPLAIYWMFFSMSWVDRPRAYAILLPAAALLSARGVVSIVDLVHLREDRKSVYVSLRMRRVTKGLMVLICLCMLIGMCAESVRTISFSNQNAPEKVATFLKNDAFTGGLTTNVYYRSFSFASLPDNWRMAQLPWSLESLRTGDISHIIIEYNYHLADLRQQNLIRRILENCTPAFVVRNDVASHDIALREGYGNGVETVLKDPYMRNIYVFRVREVVDWFSSNSSVQYSDRSTSDFSFDQGRLD